MRVRDVLHVLGAPLRWLQSDGPPGWIWASTLTATIAVTWWLAGFGIAKFLDLWKVAGGEFLAYAGTVTAVWLGYKYKKGAKDDTQ